MKIRRVVNPSTKSNHKLHVLVRVSKLISFDKPLNPMKTFALHQFNDKIDYTHCKQTLQLKYKMLCLLRLRKIKIRKVR